MTTEETIRTWRWRIVKSNNTIKTFAALIEMNPSDLSQYIKQNRRPRLDTFDRIESKLRELRV